MSERYSYGEIAKMIDHSLLNPALTTQELDAGCKLARQYEVASVCILPYYLVRCAELLRGSGVHPSTTIGFPHGANATARARAGPATAMPACRGAKNNLRIR